MASIISPSIRQSPNVLAGKTSGLPKLTADPESSWLQKTIKARISIMIITLRWAS
ncbi:uncharacterized protein FRV6_13402 [Fusarium oxysporum]|uniref:Uncharacterized protein n=1 Tax=Fusarium oxysporum TaxID=5507 RepID=A0A2H3TKV9_FUSOX|nr:uncharacterized protein FRV6_13402 [Fusarium oxysporum]